VSPCAIKDLALLKISSGDAFSLIIFVLFENSFFTIIGF